MKSSHGKRRQTTGSPSTGVAGRQRKNPVGTRSRQRQRWVFCHCTGTGSGKWMHKERGARGTQRRSMTSGCRFTGLGPSSDKRGAGNGSDSCRLAVRGRSCLFSIRPLPHSQRKKNTRRAGRGAEKAKERKGKENRSAEARRPTALYSYCWARWRCSAMPAVRCLLWPLPHSRQPEDEQNNAKKKGGAEDGKVSGEKWPSLAASPRRLPPSSSRRCTPAAGRARTPLTTECAGRREEKMRGTAGEVRGQLAAAAFPAMRSAPGGGCLKALEADFCGSSPRAGES